MPCSPLTEEGHLRVSLHQPCKRIETMDSWQEVYKRKKTSADEAVKVIKSGDRVVTSFACGEPQTLIEAMVRRVLRSDPDRPLHAMNHFFSPWVAATVAPGM